MSVDPVSRIPNVSRPPEATAQSGVGEHRQVQGSNEPPPAAVVAAAPPHPPRPTNPAPTGTSTFACERISRRLEKILLHRTTSCW